MELQSEEGDEMPLPLNSTYGGMIHHHHHSPPPSSISHNHIIIPASSAPPPPPPSGPLIIADEALPPPPPFKKISIKYRECLKNHAAGMGGNATDGCGEFMPSGDDGTLEALTCSACGCHRNFHRKEIDGCDSSCFHNPRIGRKLFVGHHHHKGGGGGGGGYPDSIGYHISSRAAPPPPPHQMIMSYGMVGGGGGGGGSLPSDDQSDEQEMMVRAPQMTKKRFRTKFSQEQKEKMLNFAERVGWKIQKQEEGVVQQFCQEIGVKRRVLKVWMHNNKHTLAKKTTIATATATSIHDHDHDHHPIPQHDQDDHTAQSLGTN